MQWLSLVLAILTVLNQITNFLEERKIIARSEAELLRRVIGTDKERKDAVAKARARVDADVAAGKLHDDDGFRRD